jgi:hypothetical protein
MGASGFRDLILLVLQVSVFCTVFGFGLDTTRETGHILGGPDPHHAAVLALSNACRHPAIAVSIASANFPDEQFGATILLYVVLNFTFCIPYIRWQQRRRIRKLEMNAV